MEKIYVLKKNLVNLLEAYNELSSIGELHSGKGFILYSTIIEQFESFIKLTNSTFFKQEHDLLPNLNEIDFTNYNAILQEEFKSHSGIINYFYGIFISKRQRLSSTERKFKTTQNIFNEILRFLYDPELENLWYRSSSSGGA